MKIMHDVTLGLYSTMRLGGKASSLVHVSSKEELVEAVSWSEKNHQSIIMVGSGSNIIWSDDGFNGLVIVNDFPGYEITTNNEHEYSIRVGAGEIWDSVVERSVKDGASGIEALSLIPGTTGATPIQNVGAYGQDVSSVIDTVEVYDLTKKDFKTLSNKECGFSYRKSIFNSTQKGKYFVLAVNFKLNKSRMKTPFYASLQNYFTENEIIDYSPRSIRRAVIEIRSAMLPDPAKVANCGSFFANPIVDDKTFNKIIKSYPDMKNWPANNSMHKLAAGWLCEQSELKGFHDSETGMATWDHHALVLVNEKAKHTADLLVFKQKVIKKVQDKFGVTLIQEPEMLP